MVWFVKHGAQKKTGNEIPSPKESSPYCWWKKSCTTWDVKIPVNNGIKYLLTGAGFLPSTVSPTALGKRENHRLEEPTTGSWLFVPLPYTDGTTLVKDFPAPLWLVFVPLIGRYCTFWWFCVLPNGRSNHVSPQKFSPKQASMHWYTAAVKTLLRSKTRRKSCRAADCKPCISKAFWMCPTKASKTVLFCKA